MHIILSEPDIDIYACIKGGECVYQATRKGREPINSEWTNDPLFIAAKYSIPPGNIIPYYMPLYAAYSIDKMEIKGFYGSIQKLINHTPGFYKEDKGNVSRVISGHLMQYKGYVFTLIEPCDNYTEAYEKAMSKLQPNIVYYLLYKAYKERKEFSLTDLSDLMDILS